MFCFLFLVGCLDNDVQLPDHDLRGKVAGEEWQFKFGNSFLVSSEPRYRLILMSVEQLGDDPCAIPSPGSAFISMEINEFTGVEDIPFPLLSASPRFHLSASNSVIASSGFVRIDHFDHANIFGYLQAELDEDNTVLGYFNVAICNF